MKITREKLLNLGFERETLAELGHKVGLVLYLKRGEDRFMYRIRWHELDEPEELLIDCLYLSGWDTISKEDFLTNNNGLASNAIKQYEEILEKLGEEGMSKDLLTPQEDLRDWLVRNWDIAVKDSIGLSLQTMVVDAKKDMNDICDRDEAIDFISERLKEGFLNVLDTYDGEI